MNDDKSRASDRGALLPGPDLGDALRLQLRALRHDQPPAHDLWPAIAGRLQPRGSAPVARPASRRPRRARPVAWLALAASLVAAVGIGWNLQPAGDDRATPGLATSPQAQPPLLRQADAMVLEYDAAMREIAMAGVAVPAVALSDLDRGAREIRAALALDPDSRFLLDRLQRLHARRLAIAQRHA